LKKNLPNAMKMYQLGTSVLAKIVEQGVTPFNWWVPKDGHYPPGAVVLLEEENQGGRALGHSAWRSVMSLEST